MKRVQLGTIATTYGTGPLHPAFREPHGPTWYWPNRTFLTEEEAVNQAQLALNDTEEAAEHVTQEWNIRRG